MTETPDPALRSIDLTRDATGRYTARNATGAAVTFGRAEDLLSPVELLLAAIAGCSAIDVDTVTSRRTEPTEFRVEATGRKVVEDGASRVEDLRLSFRLAFDDDDAGRQAAGMVDRLVALSHDKNCTVSRTVEHGTPVANDVEVRVGDSGN
ncbi:oxidoreductase [Tersicoccus phoenicis]|uniref:Oxidoreductase n=1 Tax=Tersicoccus phoenicis TaxID=554083 RepID=A0A1R1LP30_9MICC|nr:OsmC family protein [Tersicoccus phoenicis]OMH29301.1 oxidoreductase [Tersicoccus phoenicis]